MDYAGSIRTEPNELDPRFLHNVAYNPFINANSASRTQMFSSHLTQALAISGANHRLIHSGVEYEFGKYTFSIKAPTDMVILEIIEHYPRTVGEKAILYNPTTVLLYECFHTKEIGVLELPQFCSNHQYFGFQYQRRAGMSQLRVGATIAKDTIFLDSPNVADDGFYRIGRSLNVAMMSHPCTSEDGIGICSDVLPHLSFKKYIRREVEFGSNTFPLNLYGTPEVYKAFPDIGEFIRADGLLMALRDIDPEEHALSERSVSQCMKPEYNFDKLFYANGPGDGRDNGKVIDIKVIRDPKKFDRISGVTAQMDKYNEGRVQFNKRLLTAYHRLNKMRNGQVKLSPVLQNMLVSANSVCIDTDPKQPKISRQFKCETLDNWRIEFVVEYTITPNKGFKLTNLSGGRCLS